LEWIKVKDELPMTMHSVLAKDGDPKSGWKVHVAFLTESYIWYYDGPDTCKILHRVFEWTEIPE
jgi:hypothetical protein